MLDTTPTVRPRATPLPPSSPPPGVALDTPWKQDVFAFTRDHLQHSAWGLAHSERDYLVAKELAAKEHLAVDDDVLFAAAMLHDMGGFPPYQQDGVDHAVRSAQVLGDILKPTSFPQQKITAVQAAVLHHSYYDPVAPTTPEGIVLHDADTLDFLGAISAARIVSLTERDPAAPDLGGAVKTLQSLLADAPKALLLPSSKAMGNIRAAELKTYLDELEAESVGGQAL